MDRTNPNDSGDENPDEDIDSGDGDEEIAEHKNVRCFKEIKRNRSLEVFATVVPAPATKKSKPNKEGGQPSSPSSTLAQCSLSDDKLETDMITSGWYVGIKAPRVDFLQPQKGTLKYLKINQLPSDFDGGEVLKLIIEEMNLKSFHYGKIPLILKRSKQDVKEFEASATEITSAIEMIKQFPSVKKMTLNINTTDIDSDRIKEVIDSLVSTSNNIEEFVVIDNTRGILGAFLGLFKFLVHLKKLTLITNDKHINAILKSIPIISSLEEIQLSSTASKICETLRSIAPALKITEAQKSCAHDDNISCQGASQASVLDDVNDPGGSNVQRPNEGDQQPSRGGGGDSGDGDGRKDDDDDMSGGSTSQDASSSYPKITIKGHRDFLIQSSFNSNVYDSTKLFVHACGYGKIMFTEKNVDELEALISNDEFSDHIIYFNIEVGKIVVMFREGPDNFPEQFRDKMGSLAYQLDEKVQLALITLNTDHLVKIKCKINMDWEKFLQSIPVSNEALSSSRWQLFLQASDGYLKFRVDAMSYYQIVDRGNQIIVNGTPYAIEVEENCYAADVQALESAIQNL